MPGVGREPAGSGPTLQGPNAMPEGCASGGEDVMTSSPSLPGPPPKFVMPWDRTGPP